ncbi:inhibin beta B chain-like [Haliotis cracherodii]|uniref:inhibin beta B chain-like n=1 Tax=Haliotis cracherodii TaxID=6455 RepID=UPI0039E984A4
MRISAMHLTTPSVMFLLCVASITSQPRLQGLKNDFLVKNLTKFQLTEKIKQQILIHLGMNTRPTSAPGDKDRIYQMYNVTGTKAEVNEIISFSEPPDKFEDEKIIQFRFAKGTKGKRLVVKSASLLIRVKNKQREGMKTRKDGNLRFKTKRFKLRKRRRGTKVSLSVSTVTPDGHPETNIAAVKSRIKKNKWFKVSLNRTIMQTLVDSSNGTVLLHVQCQGCKRNTQVVLVHPRRRRKRQLKRQRARARARTRARTRSTRVPKLNKGRPFLILHTLVEANSRRKRSINFQCSRCCKRKLYINFTEIGWGDWIISPPGFTTGECVGECTNQNVYGPENTMLCVSTHRRTLRLIYRETVGVFLSSVLPNFIVSQCGCETGHHVGPEAPDRAT